MILLEKRSFGKKQSDRDNTKVWWLSSNGVHWPMSETLFLLQEQLGIYNFKVSGKGMEICA